MQKFNQFFIETFYQTPRVQHEHNEFIVSFQSVNYHIALQLTLININNSISK